MEKQRKRPAYRLLKRFLSLFITLNISTLLFGAVSLPSSDISKLVIVPEENQSLITDKDIKYSVVIPGINPLDVEVSTPDLQDNTQFKTLRRTRWNENDTKLELWYEFSSRGEYVPDPLKVNISGKDYSFRFAKVRIEENLQTAKPALIIIFKNGKTLSENTEAPLFTSPLSKEIYFSVYVRNGKEIINSDYVLPKGALFEKLQFTEKTDKSSSNMLYFGDFKWTPLTKGKVPVPEISLKVRANDGTQIFVQTPEAYVNISKGTSISSGSKSDNFFKDSFSAITAEPAEDMEITPEEVLQKRIAGKKKTVSLSCILILVLLIILLICFLKKKKLLVYVILILLMLADLFSLFTLLNKPTAVYTSGTVKSIPEEKGGTLVQMNEFSEVKIIKKTSTWYCIQSSSATGWTKKENVRFY